MKLDGYHTINPTTVLPHTHDGGRVQDWLRSQGIDPKDTISIFVAVDGSHADVETEVDGPGSATLSRRLPLSRHVALDDELVIIAGRAT